MVDYLEKRVLVARSRVCESKVYPLDKKMEVIHSSRLLNSLIKRYNIC
jgi:hypothetical protein